MLLLLLKLISSPFFCEFTFCRREHVCFIELSKLSGDVGFESFLCVVFLGFLDAFMGFFLGGLGALCSILGRSYFVERVFLY